MLSRHPDGLNQNDTDSPLKNTANDVWKEILSSMYKVVEIIVKAAVNTGLANVSIRSGLVRLLDSQSFAQNIV